MNEITKRTIEDYKNYLVEEEKCSVTIEKYIRDITAFINWTEGNELTKSEYERLLNAAKSKKNERLYLIMQTICATGIRVSELKYIDVNSVMTGQAQVRLKGKIRMIILPRELCQLLKKYIKGKAYHFGKCIRNKKRSACGQALDMEINEAAMRNCRSVKRKSIPT